jgi:hypothetical protein
MLPLPRLLDSIVSFLHIRNAPFHLTDKKKVSITPELNLGISVGLKSGAKVVDAQVTTLNAKLCE